MKTERTLSLPTLVLFPVAASALLLLSACGNKGPLVLPQKPVPVEEVVEPIDAAPTQEQTPPATTDTDAGNANTVPDPITPALDDAGNGGSR